MLGAAALGTAPLRGSPAFAATRALPTPSAAPFDHVVLLMMENRSFDHFLGWLPHADGRQAGLAYADTKGTVYPTYHLAPDWQGCGYADPDHSWTGGIKQLDGGRCDGFLKTAAPGDTFPIGYYERADLPVLSRLAEEYTVSDNYFCAILAETYPNRLYQHAATTDRDTNFGIADVSKISTLPTIWDRLTGGLTGTYYFSDLPFTALWGPRYTAITKPVSQFLRDCQSGNLPNVAFVDPAFGQSPVGTSDDDHPYGDVRSGEAFIAQIYHAVRQSPLWDRIVFVINFDEWGGFFEHVPPPRVTDDTVNPAPGPHPDYHQLGFRVPNIVISPYSARGRIVRGGAPFEHTSVLRMIEWRWGLRPLTARDAAARNLIEMLDFSQRRSDNPEVPSPAFPVVLPCGPTSYPAHPPAPVSPSGGVAPTHKRHHKKHKKKHKKAKHIGRPRRSSPSFTG